MKEKAAKIKHQTEAYKWSFFFLGANQDAIATAAQMSIAAANAATHQHDHAGTKASHSSYTRKISALRRKAIGCASRQEVADLAAPLSAIVEEEDAKERRENR